MASAAKTPNLNLPQWVGTEKPERTDFNAAFDAIDTTVASHLAESANKHISESGSNENGSYIKFDDGTMICVKYNVNIPYANEARCAVTTAFPAAFINVPSVIATIHNYGVTSFSSWSGTHSNVGMVTAEPSSATVLLSVYRLTIALQPGNYVRLNVFAIGRWKD